MNNKIFKDGGGAGIGSYVIVIDHEELINADPIKIRESFDNGETLYLSIIDDSTEEALLPLTGYVGEDNILHLTGRDFDDEKTYDLALDGSAPIELEVIEGITLGEGIISGGGGDIQLKTINGESIKGEGNIAITTYQAFSAEWNDYTGTNKTTKQFCDVVDADESAVIGMGYFGGARWSDKPAGLANGDVVVEILEGPNHTKAIHLIMTSSTVHPYRWEYTYWSHGSVSGWRGVQPELVSGENIKTINNESILGSGNINIPGGSVDFNIIDQITYSSDEEYSYMTFPENICPIFVEYYWDPTVEHETGDHEALYFDYKHNVVIDRHGTEQGTISIYNNKVSVKGSGGFYWSDPITECHYCLLDSKQSTNQCRPNYYNLYKESSEATTPYLPFKDKNWPKTGTTLQFCQSIISDSSAEIGSCYYGYTNFSDSPVGYCSTLVEILAYSNPHAEGGNYSKLIRISLINDQNNIASVSPIMWQYTYRGSSNSWVSIPRDLKILKDITKSEGEQGTYLTFPENIYPISISLAASGPSEDPIPEDSVKTIIFDYKNMQAYPDADGVDPLTIEIGDNVRLANYYNYYNREIIACYYVYGDTIANQEDIRLRPDFSNLFRQIPEPGGEGTVIYKHIIMIDGTLSIEGQEEPESEQLPLFIYNNNPNTDFSSLDMSDLLNSPTISVSVAGQMFPKMLNITSELDENDNTIYNVQIWAEIPTDFSTPATTKCLISGKAISDEIIQL